jgi:Mn-dependent DtxR family transcriptional regulator
MDAKSKAVLDAMKKVGAPMRPGDVAKSLQMDKDEVAKIIDQLKKDGLVVSPKRCFYAPA